MYGFGGAGTDADKRPALSAANHESFPALNQNTTGTAAGLTLSTIDWGPVPAGRAS